MQERACAPQARKIDLPVKSPLDLSPVLPNQFLGAQHKLLKTVLKAKFFLMPRRAAPAHTSASKLERS
jgi:hypothetical protein